MLSPWDAFLTRYRALGHAIARNLTGQMHEAEDVVQEAALALFRARQSEPERFEDDGHARNYFLRAVRNLALKSRARRARSGALEARSGALAREPVSLVEDRSATEEVLERQRLLAEQIGKLGPEDRDLVARRFLGQQTLAAISKQTGIPISTLHSRERALLRRLRLLMSGAGSEPGAETKGTETWNREKSELDGTNRVQSPSSPAS